MPSLPVGPNSCNSDRYCNRAAMNTLFSTPKLSALLHHVCGSLLLLRACDVLCAVRMQTLNSALAIVKLSAASVMLQLQLQLLITSIRRHPGRLLASAPLTGTCCHMAAAGCVPLRWGPDRQAHSSLPWASDPRTQAQRGCSPPPCWSSRWPQHLLLLLRPGAAAGSARPYDAAWMTYQSKSIAIADPGVV